MPKVRKIIGQPAFESYKSRLLELINQALSDNSLLEEERSSLITVSTILHRYTFDNRERMKGVLSHHIADSLVLPIALGEDILRFDQML